MLGTDQTCGNCRNYIADDKKHGVCRMNPPALIFLGMNPKSTPPTPIRISMWPEVDASQWCGQHKPEGAFNDA